ncbi:ribbon-helix-helix domain-containing protein [Methylobacterium sp. C33D]
MGNTEASRVRADGRRQLLVYLPPELIKDLKKLAVDDETTASAIVEEAVRQWVKKRTSVNRDEHAAD